MTTFYTPTPANTEKAEWNVSGILNDGSTISTNQLTHAEMTARISDWVQNGDGWGKQVVVLYAYNLSTKVLTRMYSTMP